MAGLIAVVLFLLDLSFQQLLIDHLPFKYLFYGVLVGLGESGLGSLLCYAFIKSVPKERVDQVLGGGQGWSTPFLSLKKLPLPFTLFLLLGCAAVEEILVRGVFITTSHSIGLMWGLTIAIVLSLLVQVFPWTNIGNAIYALIGTAVTAPVHSVLLLNVPDIRPVILAQFTILTMTIFSKQ